MFDLILIQSPAIFFQRQGFGSERDVVVLMVVRRPWGWRQRPLDGSLLGILLIALLGRVEREPAAPFGTDRDGLHPDRDSPLVIRERLTDWGIFLLLFALAVGVFSGGSDYVVCVFCHNFILLECIYMVCS